MTDPMTEAHEGRGLVDFDPEASGPQSTLCNPDASGSMTHGLFVSNSRIVLFLQQIKTAQ